MDVTEASTAAQPLHNFLEAFVKSGSSAASLVHATGATENEVADWFEGHPIPKCCLDQVFALALRDNLDQCRMVGMMAVEEPRLLQERSFVEHLGALRDVRYLLLGHRYTRRLGIVPWCDAPDLGGKMEPAEPLWLVEGLRLSRRAEAAA